VRTSHERAELLFELGEHYERVRQDAHEALVHYERAFELEPTMAQLVDALVRIHSDRGDRRKLAAVLAAKGRALASTPDGAHALVRAAEIHEGDLSEADAACDLYRAALEAFVDHRGALDGYLRTASTFGRWEAMMAVIDSRIEAAISPRERVELLVRGADLRLEQFLDAERSSRMLEEALELDPSEQRAYAILSRAYRHQRRYDALVATFERHLGAATSLSDKASIYGQLGEALFEAGENERAIDAFRNQADLDDRNLGVLEVLAKLYEKTGDTVQALDSYQRLGDRLAEPKRRAEAFVRAAQILDERLGDRIEARQVYLRAIDSNPDDLAAIRWLARFALDDGDFAAAARFFDREQSLLLEPIERAACLVRLADVRAKYLDDPQGATFALETAFELDPDSEGASERLVDGFIEAQQWAKARACLELLTRKAGHRPRDEQHDLFVKLGKVCVELGADDKALRAFTAAHQLDPNDHAILLAMADAAMRSHDANTALAHLQKLVAVAPSHDVELLVEAYAKMGAVRREQAQARMAIAAYEKALGLEPTHRASLRGVIELYTEQQDWRQVVAFKRQELDATYDGDARFTLLCEIADVLVDKEKNVAKAVDALEEARDLRPTELPLLHRLMALYQQLEDWRRVIETVERIIAAETDPVRRSRYVYTVAQLYRDKEQDADRALQLFEEALDANPRLLEAFERVNKILTQRKDWKSLERAFRRMIKRLQGAQVTDSDLHFNLWHNLGLIYRDRLVEPNAAIEAFKMATQHKPEEAVERQILAELYESTGQIESAVGEHALVLAKDPLRIDPYRSLYKLYARQRDVDRAFCMSAALVFLKKADDDERRLFEAHRTDGLPKIRARLDNDAWVRSVFHKDDNVFVGKVFEMIAPAAAKARMNQLAATRQLPVLDPKARQDASSTVTAITTLRWAADVLGLRAPDLYLLESDPNAFLHAGVAPPVSFVGGRVLSGASPAEIAFLAGRHMAMHRGEHVIRTLFPTYLELKVLFFAALAMVRPDLEVDASIAQAVKATSADLDRLIETREKENLRVVVQRFVESGQQADLKRWVQAVEFTSCRAGFLLCGDLETSRRMILAEPTVAGDPSPQDKLREVMIFAVSDAYFGLRKALGVSVGS
jgi:tetratricopeptide (TPR) repeat protein